MIQKSCSSLYVKIMLIIDHEMNVNNKSLITILFGFFDVSHLKKCESRCKTHECLACWRRDRSIVRKTEKTKNEHVGIYRALEAYLI